MQPVLHGLLQEPMHPQSQQGIFAESVKHPVDVIQMILNGMPLRLGVPIQLDIGTLRYVLAMVVARLY